MSNKILYWTPRILCILFIIFISMFALDVFSEGYGFLEVLLALFMHLLPSFIFLGILLISWKWELIGGILFIFLSLFTLFFFNQADMVTFLIMTGPLLFIGVLFILNKVYE